MFNKFAFCWENAAHLFSNILSCQLSFEHMADVSQAPSKKCIFHLNVWHEKLYSTVQWCTTVKWCTFLYNKVILFIFGVLCCTVLYCTVLYCTVLLARKQKFGWTTSYKTEVGLDYLLENSNLARLLARKQKLDWTSSYKTVFWSDY